MCITKGIDHVSVPDDSSEKWKLSDRKSSNNPENSNAPNSKNLPCDVEDNYFLNDEEEFRKLMDIFNENSTQNGNLSYQRCKLLSFKQKVGQRLEHFVEELKLQARKCELGNLQDDLVKCVIICGVQDNGMKKTLVQDDSMSLEKAVWICQQIEDSKRTDNVDLANSLEQNHGDVM
ncbi:hypothetical protein JTB14_005329 [Gonioctena quinquepunctata]|nr:hypothetical protein JTB14_005329 [Gonioctena quinquepunctata]